MVITPDQIVIGAWGPLRITATLVFTWLTMALMAGTAFAISRQLVLGPRLPRWQNAMEILVGNICQQIREVTHADPEPYLAFVGTLFLFILCSNLLAIIPGFHPPTGSLSTTVALALCVLVAVPIDALRSRGLGTYLRSYLEPTPLMLPFQLIGEFTRTLALAVRLFGNIMSGNLLAAILLSLAPLFAPVLAHSLGLVFGVIQAYVFAILALIYMTSAAAVSTADAKTNSILSSSAGTNHE